MKRTNIRIPWKQTVALLLFFAASFGVTAYSLGYFALPSDQKGEDVALSPFLPVRPPNNEPSPESTDSTGTPSNDGDSPTTDSGEITYVTNLSHAFNTDFIEGYTSARTELTLSQRVDYYNKLAGGIETVADATPVSYQSYTADGYKPVRGVSLEGGFTEGKEVITQYTKIPSAEDGSYQTMATDYTVDRKKVQPYMGYLLISRIEQREVVHIGAADEVPQAVLEDVTVLSLCDHTGKVLIDDIGDKTPYYARDNQNRPVFTDAAGKFYAFNGGKFVEVAEKNLRIWLRYDYPAYPRGTYYNYETVYDPKTGVYSYKNCVTGYTAFSTKYFKAFNYAENGYAVVVSDKNNALYVVDRRTTIQFYPRGYYEYPNGTTGHRLFAKNIFRLPDTLGIESIGSTGYDHGWLRIRVQALSQMSNSLGTVIDDWEALVDEKGNFFDIPEGYTLEGYSDGVLLLSKDGLYGYYSIEGKWITQPIFPYARPFIQGLAVVGSAEGTVGMIDTSGNIVLPFVYTSLSDVSSGVITAYCEGIGWETYYLVEK